MYEKVSLSGYVLYEVFNEWVIDSRDGNAFHGTFKEIAKYMVESLNFYISDVEDAVEMMLSKNHNAVHFGINKTPIYSFDKVLDKKVS